MKILFVDQFSDLGGAQRCFLDLLPALEERGWIVEAALPASGPLISRLKTTTISCGPYGSGSKSARDALRFTGDVWNQTRTLSKLISEGGFDLLYANGPRVLLGAALATRRRVPILFHAHNFLDRSYAAALTGWGVRSQASSVVACSDFVAGPLRRYVPPERLQIVRNGSSDLGYRVRDFARPWRIGIVGRIEPQKGQLEFVEAARQISEARFLIAGATLAASLHYEEKVRETARGLPVEFVGWQADRAALFAGLDLLVIASTQEGLPLVMLEAFSAGVPVVAFPVGGIPEAIQHGKTGFLITEGTSEGIAKQIRELMSGPLTELSRVAAEARSLWERSFNLTLYWERMIEVLQRAASGKASRQ